MPDEEKAKSPLEETILALGRVKQRVEALENENRVLTTRVGNLEDAFQQAFERGSKSLEEFLTRMDGETTPPSDDTETDTPAASVG